MFNRIILIASILAIVCGVFAKSDTHRSKELTSDVFVNLYVQLSVAAEQYLDDSTRLVRVQDSIFNDFDVSRDSFDKFRAKMDNQPEKWNDLWEKIVKKLEEIDKKHRKSEIQQKSAPQSKSKNK